MHKDKNAREREDGITKDLSKAIVVGMLERETRQVRAKVVPNVKRETLQDEILNSTSLAGPSSTPMGGAAMII